MDITSLRVGSGLDIHKLSSDPERRFIVGGVEIQPSNGPIGHSDGDPLCHAIADCLLGASGLGDIGDHFGDTDPQWKNVDSMDLLRRVVDMVRGLGYQILNIDSTIVLQHPKVKRFRPMMQERLTQVVGAPVSVKAKSPEEVGSLGQSEGVVAFATALCLSPNSSNI
ncbi:MAG: 2-C-methyl-D-erythritol 2,4-cyclodiphosphate synthase [Actinomycetota bacterium]|nr:2-C-methyl-D-erythritol 2,4-cyclodiphosphate synthase [Actinomycetota bacterium]